MGASTAVYVDPLVSNDNHTADILCLANYVTHPLYLVLYFDKICGDTTI